MNMNEMSDNAFWVVIVSVIACCFTMMALGLIVADVVETRWYIRYGYTRTTFPGHRAIVWVKEAK